MKLKYSAAIICLAISPALVSAAPESGDGFFALTGSGASDNEFDNNTAAVSFDVGQFFTDSVAVGLRQSFGFADSEDNSSWSGASRVFGDYHFDLGSWQPFVGANVGGIYGDEVDETFFAGPEVGVKYYVREKTYITVQTEYQVFFDSASDADNNFDDGAFAYSAGIGYHF
ncbi:MAG: hypothetical protein WD623_17280 [Marinobacter sp.]|uniref:hypothetical protein n=1 Tax=Marinobacter sp. TaxID=50741 RepID=UPI0034A00AC3